MHYCTLEFLVLIFHVQCILVPHQRLLLDQHIQEAHTYCNGAVISPLRGWEHHSGRFEPRQMYTSASFSVRKIAYRQHDKPSQSL